MTVRQHISTNSRLAFIRRYRLAIAQAGYTGGAYKRAMAKRSV